MTRACSLALFLLAISGAAQSKDLIGVFEDAVHNDLIIRQADANRLAARESRPQAWAAVLPQINGTAGITRDHNAGFQDQVNEITNPTNPNGPPVLVVLPLPTGFDSTTKTWAETQRGDPANSAGGGAVPGGRTAAAPAGRAGLLQRAGGRRRAGGQFCLTR